MTLTSMFRRDLHNPLLNMDMYRVNQGHRPIRDGGEP
jgi:hypothetical protein